MPEENSRADRACPVMLRTCEIEIQVRKTSRTLLCTNGKEELPEEVLCSIKPKSKIKNGHVVVHLGKQFIIIIIAECSCCLVVTLLQ